MMEMKPNTKDGSEQNTAEHDSYVEFHLPDAPCGNPPSFRILARFCGGCSSRWSPIVMQRAGVMNYARKSAVDWHWIWRDTHSLLLTQCVIVWKFSLFLTLCRFSSTILLFVIIFHFSCRCQRRRTRTTKHWIAHKEKDCREASFRLLNDGVWEHSLGMCWCWLL